MTNTNNAGPDLAGINKLALDYAMRCILSIPDDTEGETAWGKIARASDQATLLIHGLHELASAISDATFDQVETGQRQGLEAYEAGLIRGRIGSMFLSIRGELHELVGALHNADAVLPVDVELLLQMHQADGWIAQRAKAAADYEMDRRRSAQVSAASQLLNEALIQSSVGHPEQEEG